MHYPAGDLQWLHYESASNTSSGFLGNINGMHLASMDVMVKTSSDFTENRSKPHTCCSALSWYDPTLQAEGFGSSSWTRASWSADTSLIYSLDAVCLEAFPLLFLLLLVILVTFLKSPCSRWGVVSLEGKMQFDTVALGSGGIHSELRHCPYSFVNAIFFPFTLENTEDL